VTPPLATTFFRAGSGLEFSALSESCQLRADSFFCSSGQRRATNDSSPQIRHLHRCQRGFKAFVSHLQSGTVDGLFQRFASKHTKSVGHTGLLRGLPDAARNFVDDNVVVGSVPTNQTAEADNRIVFPGLGERASRRRNFECARNADDVDRFGFGPAAQQSVERTSKQSFRDELIKPRDDNGEPSSRSVQIAFKGLDLSWRRGLIMIVFLLRESVPPW
jgi:hypothetical protein